MRLSTLTQATPGRQTPSVTALTVAVAGLAVLALLAPFGDAEEPVRRVGVLLALGGAFEVLHGMRRADTAALRRAVTAGAHVRWRLDGAPPRRGWFMLPEARTR
jgi:seryl-tRNA(Sec) selenium transferase